MTAKWYDDRNNIALLVEFMLNDGSTHADVVEAIREPWAYTGEFEAAEAACSPVQRW